ncbi:hypothetical protein D6764_05060 [Candidatus Woesearchaeota archaeon]|nr:MAG: hypothetical protein D6764_05060 [Candidatus Woesearchaeota archaeon]
MRNIKRKNSAQRIAKLVFLAWFITFILAVPSGAARLELLEIKDRILDDRTIIESISFSMTNNTLKSVSVGLPAGAFNISVNGKSTEAVNGSVAVVTNCETCAIHLSYGLKNAVKKESSESYVFSRTLNFPGKVERMEYSVFLPPGYILGNKDMTSDPSIVPSASEIKTDGTSIIVVWKEAKPVLPQRFYLKYHGHESMESAKSEIINELSEWAVLLLISIFACLGFLAGFLLGTKKKRMPLEEASLLEKYVPASLLSPDEKEIIRVIKESKNTITQKEITRQLNWSKSKVSALMTNLEHKKIVQREKIGRNYKVQLVKEVR